MAHICINIYLYFLNKAEGVNVSLGFLQDNRSFCGKNISDTNYESKETFLLVSKGLRIFKTNI